MRTTIFVILFSVLLSIGSMFGQNAPITWIGSAYPCEAGPLSFPVIDTNFTNIGSFTLRLEYDPTVMSYSSATSINPNLSSILIQDNPITANLHKIMIAWSGSGPLNLPDGTPLFTLNFFFTGGNTSLTWNNTSGGGGDCEYNDPLGIALNDTPTELYYKNGLADGFVIGTPGNILGTTEVCQGETGVNYYVAPVANATGYGWTLPPGASITSGLNTNQISVSYSMQALSGNITVHGTSGICSGPSSPPLPVTVKPQPLPPDITITGNCILSNTLQGNQWYDLSGPVPGATGQIFCPTSSGDYYDRVTDNGCTSLPSDTLFVIVGVEESSNPTPMFYPNPASGSIRYDGNRRLISISITSVTGKLLLTFVPEPGNRSSDISLVSISPGIYILSATFLSPNAAVAYTIHRKLVKK